MNWICDASEFLTRSHCGAGWDPWLRQTYQLANLVIAFSYGLISFSLFTLYQHKRHDLPAPKMLVLGLLFLLFCGLSHLCNVVVFWWAPYRLFTTVDVMTALVSAVAATVMPSAVHRMVRLPAQALVYEINQALATEVSQTARASHHQVHEIAVLKERIRSLEQSLQTYTWIYQQNEAMGDLSRTLANTSIDTNTNTNTSTAAENVIEFDRGDGRKPSG